MLAAFYLFRSTFYIPSEAIYLIIIADFSTESHLRIYHHAIRSVGC